MCVGKLQQFQQPLHTAVFAPAAMKCVQHHIGFGFAEPLRDIFGGIDLNYIKAVISQCLGTGAPGYEANIAFGRPTAEQDRDSCHALGRPIRLISHSSCTLNLARTRARTSSPSASMSPAVASPVLIRKLQCFSETCAAPCIRPRQPA